jgi:transcriptional regulator NrdR family protein
MLPMKCPACGSRNYIAVITNNLIDSQTIRKRRCRDCGDVWFTAELAVPGYAVGWSKRHEGKPVLRMAIELTPEHVEALDSIECSRQARARVNDCD